MSSEPELLDRNGRPLRGAALTVKRAMEDQQRPRPGALEADLQRAQQIAQLQQENRVLAARVASMERALGPAMISPRPRPVPAAAPRQELNIFSDDPRHDRRYLAAATRDGDVRAALLQIAQDPAVSKLCAQRAEFALSYMARGMSVPGALDQAATDVALARYERQGAQSVPMGVSEGAPGEPVQRSAVHRDAEPPLGQQRDVQPPVQQQREVSPWT